MLFNKKIIKGYVFRLYPTDKQIELIEKSFGCSRYIYNYFLGKNKNYINSYSSIKEIPNLIKENDIITTEKLKINEMVQNKNFSKKIYDASWYGLIRQLEYKSKWKNKKLYQIETYYPSSQICNRCGYQEKKVKDLNIRRWECPNCTNKNERDINASINIMFEGLKLYMKRGLNELQVS